MAWLELKIDTCPEGIGAVSAALTAGGFADLVIEDQMEFESFLEDNRAYWDYIDEDFQQRLQGLSCIKLYLQAQDHPARRQLEQLLQQLRARPEGARYGTLELTATPLPDTDWEESWKDNYPPQPVGEKLIVLPCWLAEADASGRLPVILDPGLTFGTGAHPSTQMVMEAMEAMVQPGWSCLDLGSGSGILSIAALRLGAAQAIGVDIDPKAEGIARENAAYNGYAAPVFTALTGNVTQDRELMDALRKKPYDLVLVNIVADVIIGLAPVLPGLLEADSTVILSGILDVRLEDVIRALTAAGLTVTAQRQKEEWRCLCAKRSIP